MRTCVPKDYQRFIIREHRQDFRERGCGGLELSRFVIGSVVFESSNYIATHESQGLLSGSSFTVAALIRVGAPVNACNLPCFQ
ncbi:hypothetical protein NDU88_005493 [Pleurodeles waltl]|uniref:Uncharacterized protein n=1 Tax=Pleurodeles waltl TaxID=8319 RepID=A0AAV7VLN7_PLEWA|nr:hypothetical protein NDU88_005493 [Pleurodeles waltl]